MYIEKSKGQKGSLVVSGLDPVKNSNLARVTPNPKLSSQLFLDDPQYDFIRRSFILLKC